MNLELAGRLAVLAIGMFFGTAFGWLIGSPAIGLGLGFFAGMVVGYILEAHRRKL